MGQHHGYVAGVVAGSGVVLFVTGFVLFINDDQAQIVERQKHRRPHPNHKLILPGYDAFPDFHPLVVRKFGVVNAHFIAKNALQTNHDLGRQRNFGKQIQHLRAAGQRLLNQVDIHFGFATSGNAMEQYDILAVELRS